MNTLSACIRTWRTKNKTISTTAPGYPRRSKRAHSPTFISRNRSRKVPGGGTALMKKQPRDKVWRTFRAYGQVLKEEKNTGSLVLIHEATSVAREGPYKCARIYMSGKRMRTCMRGG